MINVNKDITGKFNRMRRRRHDFIYDSKNHITDKEANTSIEAGVDILNPVQVNCKGMEDTKALKKEFGKDLTFWGGSCDNAILAFRSPKEVREETKRRINDLAPGGGFIFAPIHIIQSVVPVRNLIAWWETFQEYSNY